MTGTATVVILAMIFGFAGMAKTSSAGDKLLQDSDLEYLGAFRVPQGDYGSPLYSGFNYGGKALAFNPKNNSLFLTGHSSYQLTAEISIPQIVNSTDLSDLKTAAVLQPFADVTEGNRSNIGEGGATVDTSGEIIGGFLVWDNRRFPRYVQGRRSPGNCGVRGTKWDCKLAKLMKWDHG